MTRYKVTVYSLYQESIEVKAGSIDEAKAIVRDNYAGQGALKNSSWEDQTYMTMYGDCTNYPWSVQELPSS